MSYVCKTEVLWPKDASERQKGERNANRQIDGYEGNWLKCIIHLLEINVMKASTIKFNNLIKMFYNANVTGLNE